MPMYRTRVVQVEAIELVDDNLDLLHQRFMPNMVTPLVITTDQYRHIQYAEVRTLEGIMRAEVGDFIIRGLAGELYPCRPDVFHLKYEAV